MLQKSIEKDHIIPEHVRRCRAAIVLPASTSPLNYEIAEPKASVLIESLRSVGYTLPTSIADIIDNSIAAQARTVDVDFVWAGADSKIALTDDGIGMSEVALLEAMRPGTKNPLDARSRGDLGRFGLGLKTASFSQCRVLTVISKPENGTAAARSWNLDYVASKNEWRLLKDAPSAAASWATRIESASRGTAVVWSTLDRMTRKQNANDAAAQLRFNSAATFVSSHLAMVFHRFIESGALRIRINGSPIQPWNPFLEHHEATYRTPTEKIAHAETFVEYRGYALPHKDKLTEAEYLAAGGPRGWNAQQGFYIYRNKRLLVSGEWLRLGRSGIWTKEKQFELARIRLDITNERDDDWQLDVKKSTATPPAQIRDRLTDLAAELRTRARGIFAHRGLYGRRANGPQELERPWTSSLRNGNRIYAINRGHPLVKTVLENPTPQQTDIEALIRLLEETVPVQQIWLDTAEQTSVQSAPYEGLEFTVIRADMRRLFKILTKTGINHVTARERVRNMEPYNRFPKLIDELGADVT